MALIFKNAEEAKNAIMASQKKEIADLYEKWADEIGERAKYYSHKSTASAPVSERYYKELKKQLTATSHEVSNEIYSKIKKNMYTISDAVVADNIKWLESFGFAKDGLNAAFSYVPDEVVRNIITGQIYDSGWSLSARIWGDNEQTLKDAYRVMAKGLAENKSIYEIAKELEAYVRPSAKLPWNLKTSDGVKIYKKQVDYNAQRLARTLAQHSYQQSFIAATQKNPFITEYIWRSNGSRVCELCMSRDGQHFKKTELPMDHPNGMCTMEPIVADDMVDQLADWFNSPDGTFPEIDEFAGNFGYQASKLSDIKTPLDFVNKYGMSNKSPNAWYNSLTQAQKAEAKMLKDQSGLTWNEWYEKHIHSTGDATQDFIKKYGMSDKSPSAWYNNLSSVQKAEAKLLKEQSGLTWQKWYEKNIFSGTGSSFGNKVATQSLDDALVIAKNKLNAIPNKTYSGIWVDDVTLADYESKAMSIAKKKQYYKDQIIKYSDDAYANSSWASTEIAKYTKYLDDLDEFETLGKQYMKAQKEVKAAQLAINKAKGPVAKFDPTEYTDEAKAMAKSFTSKTDADKFYRPYLDDVWKNTSEYEHYSVWEYTQNSNPINKSLSGYHDTWDRYNFQGLGNTKLGYEDNWRHFSTKAFENKFGVNGHKDYKSVVENLTKIIDKSELPESVFLVRGSDVDGLAGLIEGNLLSFDDAMKLLKSGDKNAIKTMLEGQTFTNHSFTSTGIAKGSGFSGNVKYEIFAPKGTHAIYAEPASYYGDTVGMTEKLYKAGQSYSSVGGEAEIIIQRGTNFRITDIEYDGRNFNVKMEIINQPDYFKTGLEHTYNGGKTSYQK